MIRYALVLALLGGNALASEWHTTLDIGGALIKHNNKLVGDDRALRPQISVGFTRLVNSDWRMRSAVDIIFEQGNDSSRDSNLLNWRVAELDYRLGDNWAISGYGGIARYYRERPSYGYSVGGGIKWRIQEQWILSMDINNTKVDISSDVPGDTTLGPKDRFTWLGTSLRYSF